MHVLAIIFMQGRDAAILPNLSGNPENIVGKILKSGIKTFHTIFLSLSTLNHGEPVVHQFLPDRVRRPRFQFR